MGSSSGVARGQLRPHFGGRSPPFLVAALCVGLCILAVSYYNLSSQYTTLELQFSSALQRKDSVERGEKLVQSQLTLKEEEFGQMKIRLENKDREVLELQQQLAHRDDEITKLSTELEGQKSDLKQRTSELDEVRKQKDISEHSLAELKEKSAQLERENEQLKNDLQSAVSAKPVVAQSVAGSKSKNNEMPSRPLSSDNINLEPSGTVIGKTDPELQLDSKQETKSYQLNAVVPDTQPISATELKQSNSAAAVNNEQLQPPKSAESAKPADAVAKYVMDNGPVDLDDSVKADQAKYMAAMAKDDAEENGLDGDVQT
jgi:myosin heavy subunit